MTPLPVLMRRLAPAFAILLLAACGSTGSASAARTLRAYVDDAELNQALGRWRDEASRRQAERRRDSMAQNAAGSPTMPMAAPAPAAAPAAKVAESAVGTTAAAADGITNVQTAGVDEGGIVKRAGDHLVVLRRGRLFTLRVGGDALEPVAMTDAYASDADPRGAWYDELLVSGSTVVVVGYSYARGGTEIGLFDLDARGGLRHRATYHLRSFDYYSARNYASRLIGRQLVFYSPTLLQPFGRHPTQMLPGLRRWDGTPAPAESASWQRLLPATRIYRTDDDFDPAMPLALHTITRCDLGEATLRCESTAVLGPPGRVFYVSQGSVYVWTAGRVPGRHEAQSAVFRIPLDGAAPTALKTVGVPIDQLSFLEDGRGFLNVLLRAQGAGEGMWGQQRLQGRTALLRVPLSAFGDGRDAAQAEHYRALPADWPTQNRFVGDWLLMGGGAAYGGGRGGPAASALAVRYADASMPPQPLDPGHAVERIEALGAHALLVGNAGSDLHFSAVRLGRDGASLAGRHVQPGSRQGETRTHGFYYRPTGPDDGLVGLPVLEPAATARTGIYRGGQGAASVLYLRERGLDFHALGALASTAVSSDDGCKASCVDWYGNARPLFVGERVFALMGYELVEGRLEGRGGSERIAERRRVGFAPRQALPGGRASPFTP
ncbi:MAG: beta-propeller domain-containing protein [Rubrivivax sp.]